MLDPHILIGNIRVLLTPSLPRLLPDRTPVQPTTAGIGRLLSSGFILNQFDYYIVSRTPGPLCIRYEESLMWGCCGGGMLTREIIICLESLSDYESYHVLYGDRPEKL